MKTPPVVQVDTMPAAKYFSYAAEEKPAADHVRRSEEGSGD